MISIINTIKMTDPSVVSTCSLGLTRSPELSLPGTGVSGISAISPLSAASLPVRERNERPTEAPEAAAVAKGRASAYAFAAAAAGAGAQKQTTQHHHTMWAFRGPEPWSDPA
ncbi:hypothetical protein [Streptomyces sp. NBC_01012]|uniref:hypothetical protein n=1 Tax=Streptomyces sp. NBC_01012 TaxID=2903717 RepID=UPI00386D500A|nr:hypothetical protein OG623_10955 [Streptomyces sp. NBC_01012]